MDDSLLSELVGKHPSLYDPKNKYYKNQNVKDNVWKEIGDILKQSVDDCKKRWKNIRDTYNRRKRNKLPTGSATSSKASKWYLQDALSFLNTVECERRSTSNVPKPNVLDSDSEEGNQYALEFSENEPLQFTQNEEETPLDKTVLSEQNLAGPNKDIPKEKRPDREEFIREKRPVQKEVVQRNGSKRQKITTEKIFDMIQKNRDERSDKQARLLKAVETRKVEEDAIDAFFRSMAMSVKQLSHSSQIRAKMEICRIVGELELLELPQSSSCMPVATQSSTSFPVRSVYPTVSPASTYDLSVGTPDMSLQYSRPSTSLSMHSVASPEPSPITEVPQGHDYSSNRNLTFFHLT